jgi:hypothetical protein
MPALQFGDLVVLPNLGEPLSPASDLVFAFEAFAERRRRSNRGRRDR